MFFLVMSVTVSQLRFPETLDLISTLGDACVLPNVSRLLPQETCAEADHLSQNDIARSSLGYPSELHTCPLTG